MLLYMPLGPLEADRQPGVAQGQRMKRKRWKPFTYRFPYQNYLGDVFQQAKIAKV